MTQQKHLSLYELNSLVRDVVALGMPNEYWVQAELSDVREWSGHCYMELIEKDTRSNTPVARAQARCWRSAWMLLRSGFERIAGEPLRAGMKVLLCVHAQFHENYGFAWVVSDIDPTYTLGDMARRRQEIVRQLKAEGVFELQKELRLPLFAQRVAVVSSATAAGYGDFCNQLADNPHGFCFHTELFAAVMQGEQVEQSVIAALNRIYDVRDSFDCVVIIRGGGSTSDLSGFDTLALAENVANFPLPIITGIGHERDESVLDMVAHIRVKTPTAAAALLVDHLERVWNRVSDAQETAAHLVRRRMDVERQRLSRIAGQIPMLFSVVRARQEARVERLFDRMAVAARQRVERGQQRWPLLMERCATAAGRRLLEERHRVQLLAQRVEAVDPERLLKRGYSITLRDGRAVRDPRELRPGDRLETRVEKGIIQSTVQ